MVQVKGLSMRFGKKEVLTDIDLHVEKGQIVAIMGSSGGGKTTLLRCIAGLLKATKGQVVVDGIDVRQNPEEARCHMGMVFQSAALFDYMNVKENVIFGARRRHLKQKKLDELTAEMLDLVGLEGTENLMPSELSGGMKKRLGIARALATHPSVILYDEPTTGLDPITTYQIDQQIVALRDRLNVTSLVVSHDISSVFRVADKVAFLEAGRLSFFGDTQDFEAQGTDAMRELAVKASSRELDLP